MTSIPGAACSTKNCPVVAKKLSQTPGFAALLMILRVFQLYKYSFVAAGLIMPRDGLRGIDFSSVNQLTWPEALKPALHGRYTLLGALTT